MPLSTFEKLLPWSGLVAGVCWIGQASTPSGYPEDVPGGADVTRLAADTVWITVHTSLLVLMGVALLFFATAVRNLLRSGEPREATYSSVTYGAWITVSGALAQMALQSKAIMDAGNDANDVAVQALSYLNYFGWLAMGVGIATAFLAFGLGGLATSVLPRWFAIVTIVLGVLALLGACAIPPGGLVNYLLLPFWLIAASVVMAKRQRTLHSGAGMAASRA